MKPNPWEKRGAVKHRATEGTEPQKYLFADLTEKIIGCAMRVHRELGPGFLESAYKNAMTIALADAGLSMESERSVVVEFSGKVVGRHRLDLIVEGKVVVELKCVAALDPSHFATLKSYLKASKLRLGLLINFSKSVLEVRRIIL